MCDRIINNINSINEKTIDGSSSSRIDTRKMKDINQEMITKYKIV